MRLSDCPIGSKARIANLSIPDSGHRHRLMDLGWLPGTEVTVVRRAPFGDPIIVRLRGFQMGIRFKDAQYVEMDDTCRLEAESARHVELEPPESRP
ncbi:MAG: FeoA family protein [Alicyclobacillaceae bacterium]|nr:FeoA family protein [Alicyclobacillaceae bacterium]